MQKRRAKTCLEGRFSSSLIIKYLVLWASHINRIKRWKWNFLPELGGVVGVVCWLWSVFSFSSCSLIWSSISLSDCEASPGIKETDLLSEITFCCLLYIFPIGHSLKVASSSGNLPPRWVKNWTTLLEEIDYGQICNE